VGPRIAKIFTGGGAPILVSKRFVFNRGKGRKRDPGLQQLSTGALSTLPAQSEAAVGALSALEADPRKLVRNAG
jgi:hypothetical protein